MSYPKSLDEYSDDEIARELVRRMKCQVSGECSYCGRSLDAQPCRFPERHSRSSPTHKTHLTVTGVERRTLYKGDVLKVEIEPITEVQHDGAPLQRRTPARGRKARR